MKREILITDDGSTTIFIPEMDETYHSTHGGIQEAEYVFIKNGLVPVQANSKRITRIFEMGFGTGLNALLTAIHSKGAIEYHGIDAYPVEMELISQLNYLAEIGGKHSELYNSMINSAWNELFNVANDFTLCKINMKIEDYSMPADYFDIIYFDAFGPRAQSSMWEIEVLSKMVEGLKTGGLLTTYCAMGQFKRDLKSLGMKVEALPGPPGKREMTVATKL